MECERGGTVLDRDHIVRIEERTPAGTFAAREVLPETQQWEGHYAMPAQFLDWLDGGAVPLTRLEDNIKSNAIMFAAIRASETGMVVNVRDMVGAATR